MCWILRCRLGRRCECQHLDTFSRLVVVPSVGGAINNPQLHSQLQKLSIWHLQEALWLKQLTTELGSTTTEPFTIYEDNQSTISMAKNPQFHGRAKHVAIKYHFVREHVNKGSVRLKYCPTKRMVADILTKGLPRVQFTKLRKIAGVVELLD